MNVQKTPKGPPFYIFRHYATYRRLQKHSVKFVLIFFHYFDIARLFRQKIFRKGSAFIFSEFCGRMDVEKYRKVPLSVFFGIVRLYSIFFHQRVPSIFLMICDRRDEKCQSVPLARQSGPTFGFLVCFRRHFDTLKSFCYF